MLMEINLASFQIKSSCPVSVEIWGCHPETIQAYQWVSEWLHPLIESNPFLRKHHSNLVQLNFIFNLLLWFMWLGHWRKWFSTAWLKHFEEIISVFKHLACILFSSVCPFSSKSEPGNGEILTFKHCLGQKWKS